MRSTWHGSSTSCCVACPASGLLDTVDLDRQPQNETIIRLAVELGRVLCQLDVEAAAERDATLRQADPPPPLEMAPVAVGRASSRGAGRIRSRGPSACRTWSPAPVARALRRRRRPRLSADRRRRRPARGALSRAACAHRALDTAVASLDAGAPHGVRDLDGRLSAWLSDHAVHAVLVRPDFYVFGSAATAEELPALLADLRAQLQMTPTLAPSGALS